MQGITEAVEVLRDPAKRRQYDLTLQYRCDCEHKAVMKELTFVSVHVPPGQRCGVAFGNLRGDDHPILRAVQPGSVAEEAGLGRYVGRRIAFVCMQRTTGWTGKMIHQRFGGRRIMVFHFWPLE
eukprot:TRINITY_DN15627_c0_g1_i2.p3 TRINITY_DN15627_c0_g1~~TRINITY_DN15627_c0_g1_i2.p3  ORF type:complete len:124 (+),score=31.05 TRINITY_DN15627_c0_g1_i2:477-848(+)